MDVLKRMIVVLIALAASSGLATAAHAAERGHGGSVASHATRHLGNGHPVFGRHFKQRHGHGEYRHYSHYRHDRRHRRHGARGHHRHHYRGGHRHRHHRRHGYRYREHYGHRRHGYGIWIESGGLRYYIGK